MNKKQPADRQKPREPARGMHRDDPEKGADQQLGAGSMSASGMAQRSTQSGMGGPMMGQRSGETGMGGSMMGQGPQGRGSGMSGAPMGRALARAGGAMTAGAMGGGPSATQPGTGRMEGGEPPQGRGSMGQRSGQAGMGGSMMGQGPQERGSGMSGTPMGQRVERAGGAMTAGAMGGGPSATQQGGERMGGGESPQGAGGMPGMGLSPAQGPGATGSGTGQPPPGSGGPGGPGTGQPPGGPQAPTTPLRRCATMDVHYRLLREVPGYAARRAQVENEIAPRARQMAAAGRVAPYRIDVVVHVVWNTAAQDISDAQVQSQIDILNEDFRRLNADWTNTPAVFQPLVGNAQIEFTLAGVTRTNTAASSFTDDDRVKSSATGGADPWPTDRYLNIWVCQSRWRVARVRAVPRWPGCKPMASSSPTPHSATPEPPLRHSISGERRPTRSGTSWTCSTSGATMGPGARAAIRWTIRRIRPAPTWDVQASLM